MIKKLRKKIDILDKKIIKLLDKRLEIAEQILKYKEKLSLPFTSYKRELEILNKLKKVIKNKLLNEEIEDIYSKIFELSKKTRILNKNKILPFSKIGIIGLGIIGGSIAKAIKFKNKNTKIFTLKRADKNIILAKKNNYIDKVLSIKNLIKECDLIILATPIECIIPTAQEIKKYKNLRTTPLLIIDVGSIKEKIAQKFKKLTSHKIEFLATHPMAGSDKSGFKFSKGTLFINYPWIITPHSKNKKESIQKISQFIKYVGGLPKLISPKQHDIVVAKVSHLIFSISTLLFAYVYDTGKNYIQFSGTSFKSTTRLASSNPYMQHQILINNFSNISKELNSFMKYLKIKKITKENSLEFFKKYKNLRDKILKI